MRLLGAFRLEIADGDRGAETADEDTENISAGLVGFDPFVVVSDDQDEGSSSSS
jgi:hypothetical protein